MIRKSLALAAGATLALVGCADPETKQRVDDLEKKVAELTEKVEKGGGATAARAANEPGPGEQEAMALYKEANQAFQQGNTDEAKAKLQELQQKYGSTRVAAAASRLLDQLTVVGKKIDALDIEQWYQGKVSLADGDATLLVFWEVWCPHCKREVPKLEETYAKFKGEGLNMIGLTKVTRGKSDDDVKAFIAENKVTYPQAKEKDGKMSDFFGVSGVPAAAVVKKGEVVWRGHPAQLTDDMIKGWL